LRKLLALMMLGAFAAVATPTFAANVQQERMKACNKDAGEKKGDDRKKFMSSCLSEKKKASDSKMAACNTKSKGTKGEEHKKFMSDCMKAA
jgi:psiF repeat